MFFLHLVFWIGFLFINTYVSFTFFPFEMAVSRSIMLTGINIIVYWVCLTYPVDLFFEKRKYRLFGLTLLAILFLSSAVRMGLLYLFHHIADFDVPEFRFSNGKTFGVILVFITQGIVVGIATLQAIARNKMIAEKKLSELNAVKTQTELALLKAKINPHFLLNTLNNIYYYSGENNEKGSNAILKLGELLRYTTYDSTQHRITLEKELTTIESLAQLYALRFSSEPNIIIRVHHPEAYPVLIPPGILLILFENALKYSAAGSVENSYIKVDIHYQDSSLSFTVENSIAGADKSLQNVYGGMGLASLKQILELEYPQKYTLNTTAANGIYTAQLNLVDE